MSTVNNNETRTTKLESLWCLSWELWIDFTPCSGALIFGFKHVNDDFVKF